MFTDSKSQLRDKVSELGPRENFTLALVKFENMPIFDTNYGKRDGRTLEEQLKSNLSGAFTNMQCTRISDNVYAAMLEGVVSAKSLMRGVRACVADFNNSVSDETTLDVIMGAIESTPSNFHSVDELLAHSNIALNVAVRKRKDTIYNAKFASIPGVRKILSTFSSRTSGEDSLFLQFQPIYDLTTMEIHAYESLVRLHTENYGDLEPSKFIEEAESLQTIDFIDRWVLEKTLNNEAKLLQDGILAHVNVSIVTLSEGAHFFHFLKRELAKRSFQPHRLVVEITETALLDSAREITEITQKISDIGCKIAIDDFGIRQSNYSMLDTIKFDYLKLDHAFMPLTLNEKSAAIYKSTQQLAENLGAKTIAEGVEHANQLDFMRECGVDYVQGYFLGKPKHKII